MAEVGRIQCNFRIDFNNRPWLFSNPGPVVKLSMNILAGSRVLSAVDTVSVRL
jgi:hypothetical protein